MSHPQPTPPERPHPSAAPRARGRGPLDLRGPHHPLRPLQTSAGGDPQGPSGGSGAASGTGGGGAEGAPGGSGTYGGSGGEGVLAPFDEQVMGRQLAVDALFRWGLLAALLLVVLIGSAVGGESLVFLLLVAGLVLGWIMLNMASVRVSQQVPVIGALTDSQPEAAEALLAAVMKRRGLQRSVRLLLYHRMAMLRHRQRRFAETATISRAVMAYPMRHSARLRPQLLLIYGESVLQCGDHHSAHWALMGLHQLPLRLVETLQLLSLQTRYEVAAGHDRHALWNLTEKVRLSELMPADQCGAMHGMFAVAAHRLDRQELAGWLQQRARLLCSERQLEALHEMTAMRAGAIVATDTDL